MTKKILCRVVKSVPLSMSTSSDVFRYASRSDNRRHNIDNAVAVSVRHTSNSVRGRKTYTRRFITLSIDGSLRGQILDCYV